jgi:hypothetical protein
MCASAPQRPALAIDPSTAFVSYSREDWEFVLRVAKDLKAKGAKVWMDKLDIRPGQRWELEVETALNGCSRMLVILSPASVGSSNVLAEAAFAIDEGKEVIPVLYLDCKTPFRLRPFQYADFRTSYDEGLQELLATLGCDRAAAAAPALSTTPAAAEKARLEQEERERNAAAEKVRLEQEERERNAAAEKVRLEQEERERNAAAEKAKVSAHSSSVVTEDEVDETWESERQKRENELTKAIVEEWSRRGPVHRSVEETQLIKNLRMALSEWLLQRPPGFESRQAQRVELQQAETRRALDSWLRSKGR